MEVNILFVLYLKDLPAVIRKLADFLKKPITEAQVEKLANHLDFANFEHNENVNQNPAKKIGAVTEDGKFIRKGLDK